MGYWNIYVIVFYFYTSRNYSKLVTYRYLGLQGVRRKVQNNWFEGAQYPWKAVWTSDGETTLVWGYDDIITGQQSKIWSGFIEQHITSDVTFGIKQYIDITGDDIFAREKGYEIIFDTAKFWSSRLECIEEKNVMNY